MINNGANVSNVEIGVFEWTKSAKDSLPESTSIYLGYYARRDIHPHEELLLDYGVKWAESWELYESLLETCKKNALADNDYDRPLFRTPIEILDPLFD